jgi:alpha-galactosidase
MLSDICRTVASLLGCVSCLSLAVPALSSAQSPWSQIELTEQYGLTVLPLHAAPTAPGVVHAQRGYPDFDALEVQTLVVGPASGEAPLFEDLKAADFVVRFPREAELVLRWNRGSHAETHDFQPMSETLRNGQPVRLESFGGRSSDGVMPYFNLHDDAGGLIVAIGWSGDWKCEFQQLADGGVRVQGGLKRSRFRIARSEKLRLPSILVMAYRGSWIEGQNRFRQLTLKHFTPQNHPALRLMPVAASVHGMLGFNDTTESNLTALASEISALQLPIDTFWLDAGWNEGGFPGGQGNPQADPVRFPHGLAPVGETVQDVGLRFLVWFEPERAMQGTLLHREHPERLRRPAGTPETLRYMEKDGFFMVDFGNPAARQAAIEQISDAISDSKISIYRQDYNQYPSYFWHTDEPDDQVGLAEVRYVNGLYDFLDELVVRHPDLIIDNCASGGRRIDFEMMRRTVLLWRSDSCWDSAEYPRNVQAMTHGLSSWLPLHGLGSVATTDVALRSGMGSCVSFAIQYRDPGAVRSLREFLGRYLPVRHLFQADYYPLTAWSADPEQWLAFQFHSPEGHAGLLQAFRGGAGTAPGVTLKLQGLSPDDWFRVVDWDSPDEERVMSGRQLMDAGLEIAGGSGDRAVVYHYQKLLPQESSQKSRR